MVGFIDFIALNIKPAILYDRIIILTFTYLIFLQDLQLFLDELRKAFTWSECNFIQIYGFS